MIDKYGVLNILVKRKINMYVNICYFFCSIGIVIIEFLDICKIIQEGCDQVVVNEVDESQFCEGLILVVEG